MFIISAFFISTLAYTQQIETATITLEAGAYDRENTLVSVSLHGVGLDLANSELKLIDARSGRAIDIQLHMENDPKLYWKINEQLDAGTSRKYTLLKVPGNGILPEKAIDVRAEDGTLTVKAAGKNVLRYYFVAPPLPPGVSEIYTRAGFIHPLWSPAGEVLTRIHPPDHYHHVGIWNPWTHTAFKGKEVDFWNLASGQGTVKPVTITSTISSNLFGGFSVVHDHIDLNGLSPQGFEVALKELWKVRVWSVNEHAWIVDFISTLNCATDSALTIKEYRYEGFGFRATEKWDDETATLLTSEGKNKTDGNGTRARWCDINGVSSGGSAGVLFITHPTNYNYPEPIRIWPTGTNEGKENVFFNFNPTMDRDWTLLPGKDYQLRYRMYVYDGKINAATADKIWQDFAFPPHVSIEVK
ncbi:MAG: hypothetical protein HC819_02825 [Cyclobacteriaceae bacterium]|nr:hypothetical protein [Cyclobacteriaceae bacterium]